MIRMALTFVLLSLSQIAFAQAIYGPNGEYRGYMQTSPNGVTSTYSSTGQLKGTQQVDSGQTNYYGSQGQYQGNSPPVYIQPNTTISTPRQAPQVPVTKGW